jgi:hypothetical protein
VAWPFIFPPKVTASIPTTAVPTTEIPITLTPSFTPIVASAIQRIHTDSSAITLTPSFTPIVAATTEVVPTTPAPPTIAPVDPVQTVVDYWKYVSEKKYDKAWEYLTKDFRERWHKDDIRDYQAGYEARNYCKIETSNGRLLAQEGNHAVVTVQVTYYTGPCPGTSVPYDFTITLVYNEVDRIWKYDSATAVKK